LPEIIATGGYFTSVEARWLSAWLDRLAALTEPQAPRRVFLHGDSQATNVMVTPASMQYVAVIDWGACLWGGAAHDFAGVPLRAVPAMLAGYRERISVEDEALEARIVWRHLTIALHQLRGQPKPEWSWAERPIGMLLEVLRFFAGEPSGRWRGLGPGG
jgi:aminoglycoside phosphotransferase (APT) family kinase protein